MAEGDGKSSPEQRLVEALRELIGQETGKAPAESALPSRKQNWLDAIWLTTAFICVMLCLYLVPDKWLASEGSKFFFDKVVPWFLEFTLVAAVLRSPDAMLAVARKSHFRWSIVAAVVLLTLFAAPVFRIEPKVLGEAVPYIQGESRQDNKFHVALRPYDVELRPTNSALSPRTIHVEPENLLGSILHRLVFAPTLRVEYPVTFKVSDEEEGAGKESICIQPSDFEFDGDFLKDARTEFNELNQNGGSRSSLDSGSYMNHLPYGSYIVTGFVENCGATPSTLFDVGPGSTPILVAVKTCVHGTPNAHPNCGNSVSRGAAE